jgi:hypothetical protein
VAVVQGQGTANDKDRCSYQAPVAQGIGLVCLAWALETEVDQAERFLGQNVVADHTAGARVEVGWGGTVAAVDAVAAALLVSTAGRPDIRWEVDGCIVLAGPLGVAVQGRDHCADHNVPEDADHSH